MGDSSRQWVLTRPPFRRIRGYLVAVEWRFLNARRANCPSLPHEKDSDNSNQPQIGHEIDLNDRDLDQSDQAYRKGGLMLKAMR